MTFIEQHPHLSLPLMQELKRALEHHERVLKGPRLSERKAKEWRLSASQLD